MTRTVSYKPIDNVEGEATLLGALLYDNKAVDQVADILFKEDFAYALHGRIFDAIVMLVARGGHVSPVTLKPLFENDPEIKELGGLGYLARMAGDPSALMVDPRSLAEHIRDLSTLRRMQAGLLVAAEECSNVDRDLNETIQEIIAHADAALEVDDKETINQVSGGMALDSLVKNFDEPLQGVECRSIPEMDRTLGPMRPKQLVILAARPGMGKTAVAISYSIGAAKNGHGVLFVSLEMSSGELSARIAADLCFNHGEGSVPYSAINEGRLQQHEKRRVIEMASRMHELPFHIIDAGSLTTTRLNVLVKRYARRFAARGSKLELVVVDYLQLMRPGIKTASRYEAISEVSQSLKAIAKDHNVAVLALAQLSREVEKRPDKRPTLADLRDSGQIEQDADAVMFLMRDEYYLEQSKPSELSPKFSEWEQDMQEARNRIEFIVAKRRNGRTGIGIGEFHGAYQAVR